MLLLMNQDQQVRLTPGTICNPDLKFIAYLNPGFIKSELEVVEVVLGVFYECCISNNFKHKIEVLVYKKYYT